MNETGYFAATYEEARGKFLAAAAASGATIATTQHPLRGPIGERLFCDVAMLGNPGAVKAIVSISATHGVEGHCGSGAQVATLRERLYAQLPADTCAILIHAINPHGFAWSRRVTEDNVDLNRNFVDHHRPYPANAPYDELRAAICPAQWDPATRANSRLALEAYAKAHGPMKLQQAISGGQFSDPLGVFFGGHAPTWSNRMLRTIFARLGTHARDIAVIDYHTGLGPYGYGEVIAPYSSRDAAFMRASSWIGADEVTSPDVGTSTSAPLVGTNQAGMQQSAKESRVTMVALEYGVRPLDVTLDAVRGDAWLHAHGDLGSTQARELKAHIRDTFYGDEPRWKSMIVARGLDITRRMLAGLAKS